MHCILYIMEENIEDFQEMLNTMKVQEFKEAKEQKKLASVFAQLKRGSNQKAQLFYKNTIYAKVLNAFMMARLQSIQYHQRLNIFHEQLQNIYFRTQLQTHFEAMKQFKNIRYQQRVQKIKIVTQRRKKNQFKFFCNTMRYILLSKKQKRRAQAQKSPIREAYKTDSLFNKQRIGTNARNDLKQAMTKQNFYKKQLQQSRNSVKSAYSMNSQLGGRRKFAAIKELPKFPQLEEIQQKYLQKTDEQQRESKRQSKQITNKTQKLSQKKIDSSRISSIANEQPQKKSIVQKSEKQKPKQKSSTQKYNKDSIIATISKIKMLEVTQLTEIIYQYSTSLKFESLISQKAFLSQSIETLEKIIKL